MVKEKAVIIQREKIKEVTFNRNGLQAIVIPLNHLLEEVQKIPKSQKFVKINLNVFNH